MFWARRLQSKESITWITPFVAGIFDETIWDSFTLILPKTRNKEEEKHKSKGN